MIISMTTQKRSYRRETRYGRQLRVTVEPAGPAVTFHAADPTGPDGGVVLPSAILSDGGGVILPAG